MFIFYGYIFYYFAALIGISIGYHRYFTHRSFKTTPHLEIVMLFLGLICIFSAITHGSPECTANQIQRTIHSSS